VVFRWREASPGTAVLAETRSADRHRELEALGAAVRRRADDEPPRNDNVLIALPPSAVDDYSGEMDRAASLWNRGGRLVMVSSTAVYSEQNGGVCHESSPLSSSSRAMRIRAAEEKVLAAGGIVVRMAGLYDRHRGPHIVFLRTPVLERRPDGIINLIHYDDAAALCVAALARGQPESVYVGCDDEPITRQALVEASVRSDLYAQSEVLHRTRFTATEGTLGRRCSNSRTRSALGWQPRHRSFRKWLESGAGGDR
jgi:nucleoside-diphosphate-sugar epimerase